MRRGGTARLFTRPDSLLSLWCQWLELNPDTVRARFRHEQQRRDGRAAYLSDSEVALDSPIATCIMQAQAFGATLERDKARQRTHDALQRRAQARHVTSGRVFGYDNIDVAGPAGERSHVERQSNEEQVAVVRRIFELCAKGPARDALPRR